MARGSNSREGRVARSELGREDRRDLDGEPRSTGRISDRLRARDYEEKSKGDIKPKDIKVGNRLEAYTSSAKESKKVYEITEGIGSRASKSNEEGWDGSEVVFYAKEVGTNNEVRFDDLSSVTKFFVKRG